jgi:type II secretory pathway pseudopilin PulG
MDHIMQAVQHETKQQTLADAVRDFFQFLEDGHADLSYESRMALKREKLAAMRRALGNSGATLMEVLMAVLILGIGMVSIASLFPISVIRSTQANYLTHSTTHRYNAEQLLYAFGNGGGWHVLTDPDNGDQNGDGNPLNDQNGGTYCVDPLAFSQNVQGNTFLGQMFRYDGISTNAQTNNWSGYISPQIADLLAMAPDTWKTQYEELTVSVAPGNPGQDVLTFAKLQNQSIFVPSTNTLRVVAFNTANTGSVTRFVTQANNAATLNASGQLQNTITVDSLPSGFSVGKVMVQNLPREFTWMMTVRKQAMGNADVTVAVFHNRELVTGGPAGTDLLSETAFANATNTRDPNQPQKDSMGNVLGNSVFYAGSPTAYLTWPAGGRVPFLRKGSYVLDTSSGYWYRVESYNAETALNQATITLDTPAKFTSAAGQQVAVFMRGIVDVYPIGVVSP